MNNALRSATATLKKGKNSFRLEYFEAKGNEGIALNWKKDGKGTANWLTDTTTGSKAEFPRIPLSPTADKTAIYRNFIGGTTPRAIGFGFPGGVNLVYSADNLAPELVWAGDFMDAGRHWTNRGQGDQPPSSEKVITLTNQRFLPTESRFKGYSLDKQGNPNFVVQIGKQIFSDSWKPGETGTSRPHPLPRRRRRSIPRNPPRQRRHHRIGEDLCYLRQTRHYHLQSQVKKRNRTLTLVRLFLQNPSLKPCAPFYFHSPSSHSGFLPRPIRILHPRGNPIA